MNDCQDETTPAPTTTTPGAPDLIVSSVELVEGELSVCEDTSFKVEATVTNIGTADAVSTQISSHSGERYFQLDWYLVERSASTGEVLYKELIRGGRDQVYGAIAPGETRTESLSLSNGVEIAYQPRPAGGRTYTIEVVADAISNMVLESNEDNNMRPLKVFVHERLPR